MTINTKLDGHDLFRNALPGYTFMIVLLSCLAWLPVSWLPVLIKDAKTWQVVILALTGLPLGYLIQHAYRGAHVVLREQFLMEKLDANAMTRFEKLHPVEYSKIFNKYLNGDPEEKRTRSLSLMIDLFLTQRTEREFSKRLYFMITRVHSLGACMLAICMAVLITISVIGVSRFYSPGFDLLDIGLNKIKFTIWSIFWACILIMFFYNRNNTKDAYSISVEKYIWMRAPQILSFYGCVNP